MTTELQTEIQELLEDYSYHAVKWICKVQTGKHELAPGALIHFANANIEDRKQKAARETIETQQAQSWVRKSVAKCKRLGKDWYGKVVVYSNRQGVWLGYDEATTMRNFEVGTKWPMSTGYCPIRRCFDEVIAVKSLGHDKLYDTDKAHYGRELLKAALTAGLKVYYVEDDIITKVKN